MEEPCAGKLLARVCGGAGRQRTALPGTDPAKFDEASPLRTTDLSGLPPTLIMTANYDPLRDEGKAYADKLQKAGVPTVYQNYENVHGFFGTGSIGQQAMQEASNFLKDKLNS